MPFADREATNHYFSFLVHLGIPVSVSLLLHGALVLGLVYASWGLLQDRDRPADAYEVGITDAALDAIAGGFQWPGENALEFGAEQASPALDDFKFSTLRDLGDLSRTEPSLNPGDDDVGGFGIGDSGRSGVLGVGSGAGSGGGSGFGSGFGAGSGVGGAGVWDLRARGNRFAYVIDFSGSIIVAVDDLKRELKRSIGRLSRDQAFNAVIFYSQGGPQRERFMTESYQSDLVPATPEAKREFFAWIDGKAPMGSTEPLQAMQRALALDPEAVFFFSDGYFKDEVVGQIAEANRRTRAQIHCLVFDELLLQDASGMPRLTDGARRLQRVAEQSGGKVKVVTGADLR